LKWDNIGDMPCSVARSLSVVGDRWTMLILRSAFMSIRRFDDFQNILQIPRHILSTRLKKLVEFGVLNKVAYQQAPKRYEYRLSEKGVDLYPIVLSLMAWGDKWMDGGHGAPLQLLHQSCGHVFRPVMVCSECQQPIDPRTVKPMLNPAALLALHNKPHDEQLAS
jgi:DNA-binding HxlR family transcriptional regulator